MLLCKGVRVVHIVIVEDVLVLVRKRDRLVHLVHLASLVQTGPPPAADQPVQVKGVALFIRLLREFVVGVLFQVVLGRIERGQAPELQDAPVTGHGGKFAGGHQLPAQPLGIEVVTLGLALGAPVRLHIDGGLAQPGFRDFLDGAALTASQEYHAVHVAQDRFCVLVIDGLALGQLLIKEGQTDLSGADHGHQLFKVWHLSRVGRLVPQHPHMMGQTAPILVVRPFTQKVEHLRKGQGHKEVVGWGGVRDQEEHRRFPVPDLVQLQFVIGHDLPELGNVKRGQPSAAGDQNALGRLARNELSRTF